MKVPVSRGRRLAPKLAMIAIGLVATPSRVHPGPDLVAEFSPPTLLGVEPAKTSIADARRILGTTKSVRSKREQGSRYHCYCSEGKADTTIAIVWTTELSGDLVAQVDLIRKAPPDVQLGSCSPSPAVSKSMRFSNGLHLGMSRTQVVALLGTPHEQDSNVVRYWYQWSRRSSTTDAKVCDEDDTLCGLGMIEVRLSDGRSVGVTVSKIGTD